MSEITVEAQCGTTREFDARSDAEDGIDTHLALCEDCTEDDIAAYTGERPEDLWSGGGTELVEETAPEGTADHAPPAKPVDAEPTTENDVAAVKDKDIATDPISVMPSHFVDNIQGVPTINRKGYCVLAEHYGISVESEPVTLPSSTDFEYAEFTATATTDDGATYTGFGSAHVDRGDEGDDKHLLAELAETRAMKRAVAWATGVGMTAQSEMENSL
jgi:hypothetical protein